MIEDGVGGVAGISFAQSGQTRRGPHGHSATHSDYLHTNERAEGLEA